MKAWCVTEENHEGYSRIVFAETRGKAKADGALMLDRAFMEVSATREKRYDKYAEQGKIPKDVLIENGWWFTCHKGNCGNHVDQDTLMDGGAIIDDEAYCAECADVEGG